MLIFYQLLSRFSRRHLVVVGIVGVSALATRCQSCRRRRLVINAVLLLSEAVSLLVAASVGVFVSFLEAYFFCCRRRHNHNQN